MEKVTLPIKTKIAAWWMIIFGGIGIVLVLGWLFVTVYASFYNLASLLDILIPLIIAFIIFLFIFLPSFSP